MDMVELPSEEVRQMLRDSLRGFLGEQWRTDGRQATPEEVSAIWTKLVGQGVASLGCDFAEGGLREILVVMAELGRAACPAPMWSAALANLALSGLQADAAVDLLRSCMPAPRALRSRSARSILTAMRARSGLKTDRRADCFASSRWRTVAHISSSPSINCARGGRSGCGRCRSRTRPGIGRLGSA
jgi:hypothetical protein